MASNSCGYAIRKTGAFISKKFPLILYLSMFFNHFFFLLSQEAAGELLGEIRRISRLMMDCTVAFCLFPSCTSHPRWLKRPNDEYLWVNPPCPPVCLQHSRCFPFDPHKRLLFLLPGLSIPQMSEVTLVSGWSCHCKSKHLTAIRAWWKQCPCKKK